MQILVKTVTRFRMDYCNTTCMQTMLTVCNIYSTYYVIQIVPLSGSYAENNEVRDFKHICNLVDLVGIICKEKNAVWISVS